MASSTETQSIDWTFARALLDQSDNAMLVFQPHDLRLVEANLRAAELMGLSRAQLTGVRIDQLLESGDCGFLDELIDACHGMDCVELSHSIRLKRADDSTLAVAVTISRLPAETESFGLLVVRPQVDELHESEESFRKLAESINGFFWIQSIDKEQFVYVGPQFQQIWGRPSPAEGATIELLCEAICAEDRPQHTQALFNLRRQGREFDLQYRIGRPDGQQRWIRERGFVIRNEAGKPIRLAGLAEDVTDANAALEKLRIQDCAVASATTGIVIADVRQQQTPIIYCNDAFVEMTGYRRDQVLGRNCSFLHGHDRSQPEVQVLDEAISCGRQCAVVMRNYRQDGSMFWSEVSISPISDKFGNLTHFVGFWNDITERIAIESKLRDSEQRYRALVENAPEAMMIFDVDSDCFVDWNKKALELFDTDAGTLGRSGPAKFWPDAPPDRWDGSADTRGLIARALDGEAPVLEFPHHDAAGQELTLEVRLIRLPAGDRNLVRASLTDVTERRSAEEQLRRTRLAVESTSDAMFVMNKFGEFIDVNRTSCERLGYSREELLNMKVADINPHYPMDQWPAHWEMLKKSKRLVFESEHTRKDGTVIPVEISKSFSRIGGVEFAFAFVRDITNRKAAEARLQSTQFAVDQNVCAIVRIDVDGRLLYVNDAACKNLQYSAEELRAMSIWDIDPSWPQHQWSEKWQQISQAGSLTTEASHRCKDGSEIDYECTACHVRFGDIEFVSAFFVDIRERKQAQARLRERETQLAHVSRLSTMGEMVAGIAHEVNQPLYSILNFSKATKNKLADPSEENLRQVAHWNEQIRVAATRAGSIIKRLRGFVSQKPPEVAPMDINAVTREAIEIVGYEIRRAGVTLSTELAPEPLFVCVDSVQTQQVLVNLLVNAVEAIQRGQTSRREILVGSSADDEFVSVFVADSGPGFPAGEQRNLFDAFVSTKTDGMGMGLAISKTIIEAAGGRLTVRSNQQGGATLRFTLPRYREAEIV